MPPPNNTTTTTELAVPDDRLVELEVAERQLALDTARFEANRRRAEILASSAVVPAAYRRHARGRPENPHAADDILAAGMYGESYGWDLTTSLSNIDIIDGTPSLSAKAKVGLIRRAGHSITGDATETAATVTGRRSDNGDELTVTYTIKDAATAGLAQKRNWKQHPKSMLWARAVSQLGVRLFPDVELGAYVEDEIRTGNEGVRSDPKGFDPADVETPELDGPAVSLADVLELFDRLADRPDLQADISAAVARRYGPKHPEIVDVYSIPDGLLPSDEIEKLHDYVTAQCDQADLADDIEDAEIVSEDPAVFMPDATELDDDGHVVQEGDPLAAEAAAASSTPDLVADGEPF